LEKKTWGCLLDYGNFIPVWHLGQELNCGDECTFYTIEEQVIDNKAVVPAFIVGRSFRTAAVRLNVTDSLQVQSLSWNPFTFEKPFNQFIGIGHCCKESWCHPDCQNDNLVLISFSPPSTDFSILSEIGEIDATTVKLGVEFSAAPYGRNTLKQAYVVHNNRVISFDLKMTPQGVILAAAISNQSPAIMNFNIQMWANAG